MEKRHRSINIEFVNSHTEAVIIAGDLICELIHIRKTALTEKYYHLKVLLNKSDWLEEQCIQPKIEYQRRTKHITNMRNGVQHKKHHFLLKNK